MPSTTELSPDEIAAVKTGFQVIKAHEQDFGEAMYAELFDAKPALQDLFKGNQALLIKKFSEMLGNLSFSASRMSRVGGLTRQLGQRHQHYGVGGADYALFVDVFIKTFQHRFPGQMSAADEAAWRKFLSLVCTHMEDA